MDQTVDCGTSGGDEELALDLNELAGSQPSYEFPTAQEPEPLYDDDGDGKDILDRNESNDPTNDAGNEQWNTPSTIITDDRSNDNVNTLVPAPISLESPRKARGMTMIVTLYAFP